MTLRLVGMDPSLRNWGLAQASLSPFDDRLQITFLDCVQPVVSTSKQLRQNCKDIDSAAQLFSAAFELCKHAHAVFVEVPVGSQNARAMASYGVCVGVLAALQHLKVPLYQLTPDEVKLAGAGKKTASKLDMIQWAMSAHPEANWPTRTVKGKVEIIESKAEHMADAVGAIHAGIRTNQFRQMLALRAA